MDSRVTPGNLPNQFLLAGSVYEKDPESTSFYKKTGSLREYLGNLCRLDDYRGVITSQLNSMASFLEQNPSYEGIPNLEIDLNLIEVSIGYTM